MSNPATRKLIRMLGDAFNDEIDALRESMTSEFLTALSAIQNQGIMLLETGEATESDMRHVLASLLNLTAEKELALKTAATNALLRFLGKLSAAVLSGAVRA
jgi:hypothetical protein